MSVSNRNGEAVRSAILAWLRDKLPQADRIDLDLPQLPLAGGSSETFLLAASVEESGVTRRDEWVLRIEPVSHRIYPERTLEKQCRMMRALAALGTVPVPAVPWFEPDASVLGAPFLVMERVEGTVPEGRYHSFGLLADADPARREALWQAALEALAAIHAADTVSFAFLDAPALGATGFDQEWARWRDYAGWSGVAPVAVQERAWGWLESRMPARRPTGLAWGDARLANMIFARDRVSAVIDWETASLGGAESDLGWWLFFDWYVSAGQGVARLDGVPGPDATVRAWESLSGRRAQALEWHEVFATLRYSMISARARHLAGGSAGQEHPSLGRLAELIAA